MKYGPLTKVLMSDLTTKYICMLSVGDIIFPNNTLTRINKSYDSAIRFKYGGELFIIDKSFTKINDNIILKNLEHDIVSNHLMYDINAVITVSQKTEFITFS